MSIIFNNDDDDDELCEIVVVNPCYGVRFYPTDLASLNSFACDTEINEITVFDYDEKQPVEIAAKNLTKHLKNNYERRSIDIKIDPVHVQYHKKISVERQKSELKSTAQFPLHNECSKGNLAEIRNLIENNKIDPMRPDQDKWYPLHHAAWNGHNECVYALLNDYSCSPNVIDNFYNTALHYAALQGQDTVVKVLLEHSDIDIILKNQEGKTCLDMCQHNPKPDWVKCTELIQNALNKRTRNIGIRLMDGSSLSLVLLSGSNTTADQLLRQILEQLDIPEEYLNVFAIWICSKNLKLQLKDDHKPLEHMADWKRCIIPQFTDVDPLKEEPALFFMRDARLILREEKKIRHPWAIRLLCFEAYHNYINSMYPCSDNDVVTLAAIFMEIINDGFDLKDWKSYLADEKNLQIFVPVEKLKRKDSTNWSRLILKEYDAKCSQDATSNTNDVKLQFKFLVYCWNLTVYGSASFQALYQTNKNKFQSVYVSINDMGIHVLNKHTKALEFAFSYQEIRWKAIASPCALEIRTKASKPTQMIILYTKQNDLINNLMLKLESQIFENKNESEI